MLAAAAAGCGASKHAVTPSTTSSPGRPCVLSASQRRAVAHAKADIRRLHRLEAPLHTFHERGTPAQESLTNTFLLEVGSAKLPVNVRSRLFDLAKGAVGLCGDCFQAIEAEEPVMSTRLGANRCG